MLKEFRDFIARGNVLDLAVAVVIGAGFAKIVDSFVKDILTPPLGLLMGGVDFTNLFISLDGNRYETLAAAQEAAAPTLNYGIFLNSVLQFVVMAFAVFLFVRQYSRLRRPAPAEAVVPAERPCGYCQMSIPIAATRCPYCTSQL